MLRRLNDMLRSCCKEKVQRVISRGLRPLEDILAIGVGKGSEDNWVKVNSLQGLAREAGSSAWGTALKGTS